MPQYGPPLERFATGDRVAKVPVQIADATAHSTRDGKPFARYVLRDRTGQINAIRWEHQLATDEPGSVALATGVVDEYRGSAQLKLSSLELLPDAPPEILDRLQADIGAERRGRLAQVLEAAQASLPETFWRVFQESLGGDPYDLEGPFWTYPAAQSKHHHERGGLAWHVLTMLALVDAFAPHYPGLDVDLLKLAVLTHDLGKIDCYEIGAGGARQLSLDRNVGHTTYSIARVHGALAKLRAEGQEITLADEESLLHCLASHHGRREWGAHVEPESAEACALHALDYVDARIRGGIDARQGPPPSRDGASPPRPDEAPAEDEPSGDEPPSDPFLDDDDDPFEEGPQEGSSQPSLF